MCMKIGILFLVIMLNSCTQYHSGDVTELPFDVENVKELGNGWVSFTLYGSRFMYRNKNGASECITQIR